MTRIARLTAAVAVLACVAGGAARFLYSHRHDATPARSRWAGELPAAEPPSSAEDALQPPGPTAIPDRLPNFTLADSQGTATSIATWAGKSLMVNFWATWCAPCRREVPLLESLRRDWSAAGFEVIGIAVDHRPEVVEFAHRMKIDYPVLVGEEDALDVAAALGFESPAFPFTVFTDRSSHIVALFVGELHPPQAELILTTIRRLNAGQIELDAARRTIAAGLHALH